MAINTTSVNPKYQPQTPIKTTSVNPHYKPNQYKENAEDRELFNAYVSQKKLKVDTDADVISAFESYQSEKNTFKDFMAFDTFAKKSYGKLYNKVNSDDALYNTVRSQYEYNKKRIQNGLDPLRYVDPTYDPNQYDEINNEYLSDFVSKNKRMPNDYDMIDYEQGFSEYAIKKQAKSFADQGYKYTSTEEDTARKEQGLPPLSYENTQEIAKALDAVSREEYTGSPSEFLEKMYAKYPILADVDSYFSNLSDSDIDEYTALKTGTKTANAPFNIAKLQKMGYDTKAGFAGMVYRVDGQINAQAIQQQQRDTSAQRGGQNLAMLNSPQGSVNPKSNIIAPTPTDFSKMNPVDFNRLAPKQAEQQVQTPFPALRPVSNDLSSAKSLADLNKVTKADQENAYRLAGSMSQNNPINRLNDQTPSLLGGLSGEEKLFYTAASQNPVERDYINLLYGKYDYNVARQMVQQFFNQKAQKALNSISKAPGATGTIAKGFVAPGVNILATQVVPRMAAETVVQNVKNVFTGKNDAVPSYSLGNQAAEIANASRETFTEGMSGTGKFFADSGLSIANNVFGYLLYQGAAPAVMGAQAFGSAAYDAGKNGATGTQQLVQGVTQGAEEFIGEKASFGMFNKTLNSIGKKTVKQIIKNVAAQMTVEFTEESATQAMNILSDMAIMGSQNGTGTKSQMEEYFNKVLAENPSLKNNQAFWATVREAGRQILLAGAQGAVSGLFMGGSATVIKNQKYGKSSTLTDSAPTTPNQQQPETKTPVQNIAVAQAAQASKVSPIAKLQNKQALSSTDIDTLIQPSQKSSVEAATGLKLDGTASENRAAVKAYAQQQMASKPIIPVAQQPVAKSVEPVQYFRETAQKAGWSEEKIKGLESFVTKANGIAPIIIADVKDPTGRSANGKYENGKIYINPNSTTPVYETLKHEVTHLLKTNEAGKKFYATVTSEMKSDANFDKMFGLVKARYAQVYKGNNIDNLVMEELVSNFTERYLFNNPESIKRFATENRTLAQKVLNWVRDLVVSVKGTPEEKNLRKIEKMYVEALNTPKGDNYALWENEKKATAKYSLSNLGADDFYDFLLKKYGVIEKGESPARDVSVPKQTSEGTKTRVNVRTQMESKIADDVTVNMLKKEVEKGTFAYVPESNASQLGNAKANIAMQGYDGAFKTVHAIAASKKSANATDIATTELLLADAIARKDYERVKALSVDLSIMGTESGRALQAFRILKKMGTEGALLGVQAKVDKINQEIGKRFKGKADKLKIEIPTKLIQQLSEAKDQNEIDKAVTDIGVFIGKSMPNTLVDKLDHWRYLSMLGNPLTHIRNFIGNSTQSAMRRFKNALGAGIESAAIKYGERTKAILTAKDKPLKDYAKADFKEMKESLLSVGRYGIDESIERSRTIFKTKWLEAARRFNLNMLEKEDAIFLSGSYRDSFAQYLKANKISTEFITPTQLEKARNYATQEAFKATYRNANAFSDFLNSASRKNKAAKIVLDATIPFKKTPANILLRAIEYSPAGLIKSAVNVFRTDFKGKSDVSKLTPAQLIDGISANLTGTAIVALGVWLASLGILKGRDDEEDKDTKAFSSLQGEQQYSIQLGNTSYSIDWLVPFSMPLIMGVEAYKFATEEAGLQKGVARAFEAITSIGDPMLELSMVQGITRSMNAYADSTGSQIAAVIGSAVSNYLSQYVPTVSGQLARTIDSTERSTYSPSDSALTVGIETFSKQIKNKIPGASFSNQPIIDQLGNEKMRNSSIPLRVVENFISPSKIKTDKTGTTENELDRLQKKTGESGVIPRVAPKMVPMDNQKYYLNDLEYTSYQKTLGKTSKRLNDALVFSKEYSGLSDIEKASVVMEINNYASYLAKKQFFNGRGIDYSNSKYDKKEKNKVEEALKAGIPEHVYIMTKTLVGDMETDKKRNGDPISGSKKRKVIQYIKSLGLSLKQQKYLYNMFY